MIALTILMVTMQAAIKTAIVNHSDGSHPIHRQLQNNQCSPGQFQDPYANVCRPCQPKCSICVMNSDPARRDPPICTRCDDSFYVEGTSICRPCILDCIKCISAFDCDKCAPGLQFDSDKKRCHDPSKDDKKPETGLIAGLLVVSVCLIGIAIGCVCLNKLSNKIKNDVQNRRELEKKVDLLVLGGRPIEILELNDNLDKRNSIKSNEHDLEVAKPNLKDSKQNQTNHDADTLRPSRSQIFNNKETMKRLKKVTIKAPVNTPYRPPV